MGQNFDFTNTVILSSELVIGHKGVLNVGNDILTMDNSLHLHRNAFPFEIFEKNDFKLLCDFIVKFLYSIYVLLSFRSYKIPNFKVEHRLLIKTRNESIWLEYFVARLGFSRLKIPLSLISGLFINRTKIALGLYLRIISFWKILCAVSKNNLF